MKIRWPRGRYNGQRIVGGSAKVRVNVLVWRWLPWARWNFGNPTLGWLCVVVHFEGEYE